MLESDPEMLQRRMNAVRQELDEDFQQVSQRVRELGVWQSYMKHYPWLCLGTAASLGYLIIPKKKNLRGSAIALQAQGPSFDQSTNTSNPQDHRSGREVAISFLGVAILRGISTYIGNRVLKTLESYDESKPDENASSLNQRLEISLATKPMIQRILPPDVPARTPSATPSSKQSATTRTVPTDSVTVQVKRYTESCIEHFPKTTLGSALCLGLCIGWLIKRK
jgi:ElaB/YqjD/DUF883 family membrane-anchored ribosome-binding protein